MAAIALLVSLDTKAEEAAFLRDAMLAAGAQVLLVDFGTNPSPMKADVDAATLARLGGCEPDMLRKNNDRAKAIDAMMSGAAQWAAAAFARGEISGILSIGGSGGTAVGTAAMRALPFGAPKVMVSTVAASDTRAYVGTKDVTMINSVVDFAGVNPISRPVLRNAAAAVVAMAKAAEIAGTQKQERLIAVSQFGVTTPAVEEAHRLLAAKGFTLVPFHATGIGGRTMESLIDDGLFEGVLDLTTTEWADEVAGGNLSAGPDRLGAAGRAGVPQVVAPGALDMANFFNVPVPRKFHGRQIHHHNAQVALMRTTPAENTEIGRRIAAQLNAATGPVTVLFPLLGVSALDIEGGPFFNPAATDALRQSLEVNLASHVHFRALDLHINDPRFAAAAVTALLHSIDQQKAIQHA
jgi:uncharacterized protein (UPF0261 family)